MEWNKLKQKTTEDNYDHAGTCAIWEYHKDSNNERPCNCYRSLGIRMPRKDESLGDE